MLKKKSRQGPTIIRPDVRPKTLTFGKDNNSLTVARWQITQMIDFLNDRADRPIEERDRLIWILNEMKELTTLPIITEKINGPIRIGGILNPELASVAPEKYERTAELLNRAERLNEVLVQYRFTPVIQSFGPAPFTIGWHRDWRGEIEYGKPPYKHLAGQHLELILNIARAGELGRIRHCDQCQKWHYAMRSTQKFCSMKCQQKRYTQTEEFKAQRRAYMKERYRTNYAKPTK